MVGPFQDPENAHGQSRDGPNRENAHNTQTTSMTMITLQSLSKFSVQHVSTGYEACMSLVWVNADLYRIYIRIYTLEHPRFTPAHYTRKRI